MAKRRPFKSIRPNAEEELTDADEGDRLCEELLAACQDLEDEDLDGYQETSVEKAKAFARSVQQTIAATGRFTEGQRTALANWGKGVARVREQLERRR